MHTEYRSATGSITALHTDKDEGSEEKKNDENKRTAIFRQHMIGVAAPSYRSSLAPTMSTHHHIQACQLYERCCFKELIAHFFL